MNGFMKVVPDMAWSDLRKRIFEFPSVWNIEVYHMRGYDENPISAEAIIGALRSPIGSRPLQRIADGK